MHDHSTVDVWFVLTRAAHIAACLLLLAVFAFDRFVARVVPSADRQWKSIARRLVLLALLVALLTGVWWFALVTIEMSGLRTSDALKVGVLGTVWNQTHFGQVWKARTLCWLGAAVAAAAWFSFKEQNGDAASLKLASSPFRSFALAWLGLLLSDALCAGLAWAGHAQITERTLISDVIHLLVSGFWPAGLAPFVMLLYRLRQTSDWSQISVLTHRFSVISITAVLILMATGFVNSWELVGSIRGLVSTTYGQVLLLKIALFATMVAVGAINHFFLMPRLANAKTDMFARRLELNVTAEILLTAGVMLAVGLLGLLPPAAH